MKDLTLIATLIIYYFCKVLTVSAQIRTERITCQVGDISFDMVLVEGSEFEMGALPGHQELRDDETVTCMVRLSDYYVGETEVTQQLWKVVMGVNPSFNQSEDNLPVEMVSWNDCQKFISRLNLQTGMHYRLLTEAEWEYAARGGILSKNCLYAGSELANEVAWYDSNAENHTHPVKSLKPNELGLYDMCGNVWEWVEDRYAAYTPNPKVNPHGEGSTSNLRVDRGGSWCNQERKVSVLYRGRYSSNFKNKLTGLRLGMTLE